MEKINTLFQALINSKDEQSADKNFLLLIDTLKNLSMEEDVARQFILRCLPKPIVATRMVPRSHPEEMGENGLMWLDYPR